MERGSIDRAINVAANTPMVIGRMIDRSCPVISISSTIVEIGPCVVAARTLLASTEAITP